MCAQMADQNEPSESVPLTHPFVSKTRCGVCLEDKDNSRTDSHGPFRWAKSDAELPWVKIKTEGASQRALNVGRRAGEDIDETAWTP